MAERYIPPEEEGLMEFVYAIVFGAAIAAFVSYPFWGRSGVTETEDPALAGLEAARDSKYREIRDAETDLASGKMTQEDFDRVNADLRQDAVDILDQLEDAKTDAESGDKPPKSADS